MVFLLQEYGANIYTDVAQLKNKSFDLIILTVKSYDTESAAKEIKNMLRPHTVVVHLQNGLGPLFPKTNHMEKFIKFFTFLKRATECYQVMF